MIQVNHNFSLKEFNTFGISAFAKAYSPTNSIEQLKETLSYYRRENIFLLGGGSNMLITQDIETPVIHVLIKGIKEVYRENTTVRLQAMAGENWHEFVMYCISKRYAGVENLALIPGNIGTSPIQNIGAYGVELKDVFYSCTVLDLKTQEEKTLFLDDCKFGYRDSIFKNEAKGKYVITSVTLELTDLNLTDKYQVKTSYGAIQEELNKLNKGESIDQIAQAVINIRSSKLPDPKLLGNSGSFFKNPIIDKAAYHKLLELNDDIPSYPVNDDQVKVPAGWLIDKCGLKGYRDGDAAVHDKQALVLVNHGNATGSDIINLARFIQNQVYSKFGIKIHPEVNLIKQ
ncbi:UDP-N-acetylmuramate dehydrogenase [Nonlabens sp. MIC269]|uniref:UDP-N-acetylmuramate dehydrogenase n=1 Tax=Nonlabens sp. MIC269 TaxID=1476901 RepID=UPI0009EC0B9C